MLTPEGFTTPPMVEWGERDRKIVGKCDEFRARKGICIAKAPVPQTDTGRWEENSKANGRRVVKELGILTP